MQAEGIKLVETKVGDRYVLEQMRESGYNLGGEQSGHIIFFDHNTTGDGMLSAIQLMKIFVMSKMKISHLASEIPILPQHLLNVQVDRTVMGSAEIDSDMKARIDEVEKTLGKDGRVLVRSSGTEPLIRIMLEGKDCIEIEKFARYIAEPLVNKYNGICR